jgi:hypothetical protein
MEIRKIDPCWRRRTFETNRRILLQFWGATRFPDVGRRLELPVELGARKFGGSVFQRRRSGFVHDLSGDLRAETGARSSVAEKWERIFLIKIKLQKTFARH